MTKKNKFNIPDKKGMVEIIKMGVEMDIPDVKDVITDEDLLAAGYSLPPADLLEKTKKRIAEEQKASKKVYSFRKARKVIVIAAAIFILMLAAMQAEGVRVYVFGIVNRITDNAIKFNGTTDTPYTYEIDEKQAYKDAEEELGIKLLKPTYLPDGFVADRVKIYPNSHALFLYKNESSTIKFNQSIYIDGMNIQSSVHSDDDNSYTIAAHNKEIIVNCHNQAETNEIWMTAVWRSENIIYKIEGNCKKEEFEKFIINLK